MIEHFKNLMAYLAHPDPDALKLSMDNVHGDGVFSLVIHGTEFGNLTRVFLAKKALTPFQVQLHTHRYPIRLTVLQGDILHHIANEIPGTRHNEWRINMSKYEYRSPLNGGRGLTYDQGVCVELSQYHIPVGCSIDLSHQVFHTMTVSEGSIWVVEEGGFMSDRSYLLGVPFTTDGLYTPAQMFQINNNCELVRKALAKIINEYAQVD